MSAPGLNLVEITLAPAVIDDLAEKLAARLQPAAPTEPLTCDQFAARVHRKAAWVQRQIRNKRIRAVPGSRPYLIPASELARWLAR